MNHSQVRSVRLRVMGAVVAAVTVLAPVPAMAFNPQPDPPGVVADFNPQPDPPGAEGVLVEY